MLRRNTNKLRIWFSMISLHSCFFFFEGEQTHQQQESPLQYTQLHVASSFPQTHNIYERYRYGKAQSRRNTKYCISKAYSGRSSLDGMKAFFFLCFFFAFRNIRWKLKHKKRNIIKEINSQVCTTFRNIKKRERDSHYKAKSLGWRNYWWTVADKLICIKCP